MLLFARAKSSKSTRRVGRAPLRIPEFRVSFALRQAGPRKNLPFAAGDGKDGCFP